jgi:hypothetical protein
MTDSAELPPASPLQYGYPLRCPVCEAPFTRLHQLETHMQTAHTPVPANG